MKFTFPSVISVFIFIFTIYLLIPTSTRPSPKPSETIYLGVLENFNKKPLVRIPFRWKNKQWTPMETSKSLQEITKNYPQTVNWFVTYDGKKISTLTSHNPAKISTYKDIGIHEIKTNLKNIPIIKKGKDDFASWMGAASSRPLILVSEESFNIPEKWEKQKPKQKEILLSVKDFKKQVKTIALCDENYKLIEKSYKYPGTMIQLVESYKSKGNSWVIGLELDQKSFNCELKEKEWGSHWFFISSDNSNTPKKIKFLGSEIHPIGMGDFNKNGQSEWLFFISRYNRGGYKIFSNNFEKSQEFTWSYH